MSHRFASASALAAVLLLAGCITDKDAFEPTPPAATDGPGLVASDFPNPRADFWPPIQAMDVGEEIAASQIAIGTLTPATLNATLAPGETVVEDKLASLPAQADVVDIMFAFDNTGSMGGELDNLKLNAVDIMTTLAGSISDVRFGLVSFADYEGSFANTAGVVGCDYDAFYGFAGDLPYVIEQTLDPDITTVGNAISALGLSPGGGADLPESYSRALYELTQELLDNTGPDGAVGWREEARRIVIMFGDAFPHDCDTFNPVEGALGAEIEGDDFGIDPGRDGAVGTADDLDILDVLADMAAANITLISLHSVQTSLPGLPEEPSLALWTFYAEQTGGTNFEINTDGSFPPGTTIVETIQELVGEQISTVDELVLDVCPGDEAFADWVVSLTPTSYTDIELPADRDFDLELGPPLGTASGVYEFDICAIGDGAVLGRQDVTITVPGVSEPQADLSISKSADPTSVLVGEDITWTITVENAGPDAATNVVVTDVPPDDITAGAITPSQGSCGVDASGITCDLGTIESGGSATIDIVTTANAAGTLVNSADVESDVADPNGENNSTTAEATAEDPPTGTEECTVIDFESSGDHLSLVSSFDLGGSTIDITVEPGGPASQAAALIYDTDTSGGPDPDLEWDGGTCADCAGQGNVVAIAATDPATNGDSGDGGVIVMTGFPTGFEFRSLVVVDSDELPYRVRVDGVLVGSSTPAGDGNVQTVDLDANTIGSEVRVDFRGDSGAMDDLEFCTGG